MTWRDPNEQRERMARRFRRCAEQVDVARHSLKWVRLSVEGNFDDEITGRDADGQPPDGSVGATLDRLSADTLEIVARLDEMFRRLHGLADRLG